MRNPITSAMASDLPSVLFRSSPRLLKDSLQLSPPGLHAGYVQSGSDTIFGRSAIFRATMLVVGLLLLVLVCIARWESILHCLFCHRFFSARPPAQQQQQELPREMQKAWSKVEAVPVARYSSARAQECRGGVMAECMICLNEFWEGEMIRILPKCSHYFHMQCVDLWLVCHLSCPICRKNIADTLPFSFKRPAPSPPQLAV